MNRGGVRPPPPQPPGARGRGRGRATPVITGMRQPPPPPPGGRIGRGGLARMGPISTDAQLTSAGRDGEAYFDVQEAQKVILESQRPQVLDEFFESAKIVDTTPGSYKSLVRNPNKNTGK